MIKVLINRIVDDLRAIQYLQQYTYRKRDCRFIRKSTDGYDAIELHFRDGFDLKRNCRALVVKPLYIKRFNILHEWFEKFSFKSLSDQRDNYSIGFDGKMINGNLEYYFQLDQNDYESDFCKFKDQLIAKSKEVSEKYNSLLDLYDIEVAPVLQSKKELPTVGADWIFEMLKLCMLVKPANYALLKNIILDQVEVLHKRGEPNVAEYYSNLNNILFEIEKGN